MRDERKEERSKQGQTNNKAKKHSIPKAVKKNELPQVGLHVLLTTCMCTLLRKDLHVHVQCMYIYYKKHQQERVRARSRHHTG